MTKYKSKRFVDRKLRWVIVDGDGITIDRNPSKEELKSCLLWNFKYNDTNTCTNIKENGNRCEEKLVPRKASKECDKKGNLTEKWICGNCYGRDHQKNNSNSTNNIIKSLRDRRTGNLDPNSSQAIGDLFEELTVRWRSTVSIVPVENLNIKNDNYSRGTPIDHSFDSELGLVQTQGRFYSLEYRK